MEMSELVALGCEGFVALFFLVLQLAGERFLIGHVLHLPGVFLLHLPLEGGAGFRGL